MEPSGEGGAKEGKVRVEKTEKRNESPREDRMSQRRHVSPAAPRPSEPDPRTLITGLITDYS